jgi:CubicO group peptidase (beta-lactamase class C family)
VTVRHLLAQTSGIPNPLPLKWVHPIKDHDRYDENRVLQETMRRNAKLRWIPGEKYGYSNISYWLLGKVIESVSGGTYAEYLRAHVFGPLEIKDTEAGFHIDVARHATGYQTKLSLLGLSLYFMMDRRMLGDTVQGRFSLLPVYMNGPAYGGLICTATGFARFLQDLLRAKPRLFSATTKDLLLTKQLTNGGHDTGMTLGFRTGRLGNDTYYGKPGGGPGFRSNVRIYPNRGIGIAWLANETGASENEMNAISDLVDRHWLTPAETRLNR